MQDQKSTTCNGCGKEAVGIIFHAPMCLECMKESLKLVEMVISAVQLESAANNIQH